MISIENDNSNVTKSRGEIRNEVSSIDKELLTHGKNMFYGSSGELQDYTEAYNIFNNLASRNNPIALQYLGRMRLNGLGCKKNLNIAINNYNKGVKLGNFSIYAELGSIYLLHNKLRDIKQAFSTWDMYFDLAADKQISQDDIKHISDLLSYCVSQKEVIPKSFYNKINLFKQPLIEYIQNEIAIIESNKTLNELAIILYKERFLKILQSLA